MICEKMSSKDHTISETEVKDNDIWSGYHKKFTPLSDNPRPIIFRIIENCSKVKIIIDNNQKDFDKILNLKDVYVVYNLSPY